MKKVFNYIFIVLALGICMMDLKVNVNATEVKSDATKTAIATPTYNGDADIFVANGTP